jgi:hypothetical protein
VKELTALKDDFYRSTPPTIVTPEMLKNMEREVERRKKMHPNSWYGDELRADGAPEHWLDQVHRLDP